MTKGTKRTSSSTRISQSKPKRARFKDIQPSDSQQVGATSAGGSTTGLPPRNDSHILPAAPQPVTIENKHVYSSSDGRRAAQQSNTRSVTVNPAEWVFRRIPLANASTDSSEPVSTQYDPESGNDVALDPLMEDDEELVNEVAAKKHVRTDLRAAAKVREWLPFRDDFLDELLRYEGCDDPMEDADITGIQVVRVRFCECLDDQNDLTRQWRQLFREGWFPATTSRPETVFTFQVLSTFQELNLQGKTNLYDFAKTLERLTDNSGGCDVPNVYKALSHVIRLWRHLVSLKRSGRAHDPEGVDKTKDGGLAVECPACPHPGKNIPDDWLKAPPHIRWMYTLFLMMDANFRARCKDRGFDDIQLASGWSYYVEETRYQQHLDARSGDRQDENTCSVEHSAIQKAGIRKEGYLASGVGAVLCARHALVRPNGAGDLQLGERQANMDYLMLSSVLGCLLALMISYDIVCQWYRHLWERMKNFPETMQLDRAKIPEVRFGIPKEHIRVHGPNHSRFSFNFLKWVGRTYGEGVESQWSHMNPLATSTREMSPGMRHEIMNEHWGSWNWSKLLGFGSGLLRALEEAHAMRIEQGRAFTEYSATFDPNVVATWEGMISAWNEDQSRPDPYEEPKSTSSAVAAAKHENALEDAEDSVSGKLPAHEVTPGVFLQVGLELEEQQRALRLRGSNGSSLNALTEQQTKRTSLYRRIEVWRGIQDVHMPTVAPLRAQDTAPPSSAPAARTTAWQAENALLLLPSSLPSSHRATELIKPLLHKECRLRRAQLSDALDDIRHLRRILAGVTDYTRRNGSGDGQRMSTRCREVYARFNAKVKRAVERYRAARVAMLVLEPNGDWVHTYQPLLDTDLRGPRRDQDDFPSEGRYDVSWIWLAPSSTLPTARNFATPASAEEFAASMRVEWARTKARAERWEEEEQLLLEEMRRVIAYCGWKANWWREQADRRGGSVSKAIERGLRAYSAKQAAVWEGLARRSASWWVQYLKTLGPLPDWLAPYERHARKVRLRDFSKRRAVASQLNPDEESDEEGLGDGGSSGEEDV
ncbi:hypothetical protein TRAPUB_9373 [Trametes pubescens]|uniref:CxC2-like cysteine cluster KDZ transposase-associated domain-containing protein n=1 Tax=Trametes pubescens TaxID=154538 RepID=A0A1M2W2J8_TRAPU|nr:hypothetical protein TRAPUB_9373 [Trametes pubescens]